MRQFKIDADSVETLIEAGLNRPHLIKAASKTALKKLLPNATVDKLKPAKKVEAK